jgi:hypothetical protein
VALDKPLYDIALQIQWTWPNRFCEQDSMLMFGGLHIEIAFKRSIDDWLDGMGVAAWTTILVHGSDLFWKGRCHATYCSTCGAKYRHAHQVLQHV